MIYLDNAATTKPCEKAFARATAFALEKFYNPSALYTGMTSESDFISSFLETHPGWET